MVTWQTQDGEIVKQNGDSFQDVDGASYQVKVLLEANADFSAVKVAGFINGALRYYQEWKLSAVLAAQFGAMSFYLPNLDAAQDLALDSLKSQILAKKLKLCYS